MSKKRRICLILAAFVLLTLTPSAFAEGSPAAPDRRDPPARMEKPETLSPPAEQPRMRALLIGCDHFLSMEDTWPAADNNLRMLADTLQADRRRYALIRSYSDSVATVEAFEEAVRSAFENAGSGDISLLYISTHGVYEAQGEAVRSGLLLSDGNVETLLDAAALQRILDAVPGKKVVILDACNSGAMIGKGLSEAPKTRYLSGPDYKVLCSAGGSEASWYYQSAQSAASTGASYFATVLAYGLGNQGDFAADRNQDGQITLEETYAYLYENYAASTPQVYPQQDDFVLFAYDANRPWAVTQAITDLTFGDTLLTAGQSEVTFSFTVHRQVELYYQIVYHRDGAWQFSQAQHYLDGEQLDGTVLPGRKERALTLDTGLEDAYGYAMIQLITMENGQAVFQGARLLCVQPAETEVRLEVTAGERFAPETGEEMLILVQHNVPCGLTVSILNEEGKAVRRLAYDAPTRPQQLTPNASTFYWDGRTASGDPALPGTYTALVRVRLGEETYTARSGAFMLTEASREAEAEPAEESSSASLTPAPSRLFEKLQRLRQGFWNRHPHSGGVFED